MNSQDKPIYQLSFVRSVRHISPTKVWFKNQSWSFFLSSCVKFLSSDDTACIPVPTKTLSYDSCVTITIRHYCLDTRGPCNN